MIIVYNGKKDTRLFKDMIPETIQKLMSEDENVVWLDADLMCCSGTAKAAKDSERFINCGIAEANMVGIAAGLSAMGFKPYAHSFGAFASRRCYDQAFLSGGYAKNPITIIGTDPGITATFNGGTHMPFEDVALFRAMPEASIVDITDVPMLVDVLTQVKDMPGVKYIRLPRKDSYQFYADGSRFEFGKGIVVKDGTDAAIISCGIMVHEAMEAALSLEKEGVSVAVIDIFSIKPLDEELVREYAKKTGNIVTAENHNKIGGLYSAVKECLNYEAKVSYVAVEDEFGEVGPLDYLREHFDLTSEHIMRNITEMIGK